MTPYEKLTALRELMRERKVDAYVVSSTDAHHSEYVAEHWKARAWLTGFTGSNGTVCVTQQDAGLWTDGRYFIEAQRQLEGSGVRMFKSGMEGVAAYEDWLADMLPENGVLGFDGRTFSVTEFDKIKTAVKKKNISFAYNEDMIGSLWTDRPPMPKGKAFEHALRFTGISRLEKLAAVREAMRKKDAHAYFTGALDNIAWLLNLRGDDIPLTPVVYAFCLVSETSAHIFIDPEKLDGTLDMDGFTLHPYDAVYDFLRTLEPGLKLLYDASFLSVKLAQTLPSAVTVIKEPDLINALKAVKNETEIQNIRNAHIKEGVVMVRLLKWLEEWKALHKGQINGQIKSQPSSAEKPASALEEADIHGILTGYREAQADYLEPSFETIAAFGENAASMHYAPIKGLSKKINAEGFLLVDTGAQYLDGTTDITRTIVMGEITDEMKRDFTLVLKGHMALASAVFLYGATGTHLDVLARQPLWAYGLNYLSGTGHGLGYCLGVHESPPNISQRISTAKLQAGMLVTDEPGVYKEGRYGIRTENVLLVKEKFRSEDGVFMDFEIVSFCPIDLRAIDLDLLTPQETAFLNEYHRQVRENLSPHLTEDECKWLAQATRSL